MIGTYPERPPAELVDALGVEPTLFGRQMASMGCRSKRERIPSEDGTVRQVRGYFTADIRATADAGRAGNPMSGEAMDGT